MAEGLWALLELVLMIAAWFAPVAFFAVAGFVAYRAAAGNERAHNLIMGLFVAVWLLIVALIFVWLG